MKDVLEAVDVVLLLLKGCFILPVTEMSLSVKTPKPPLIDGVDPSNCKVPVT